MGRDEQPEIFAKPFRSISNDFAFSAAFALPKGSLKRLRYGNGKSGYGGDTPCSVSGCINAWAA